MRYIIDYYDVEREHGRDRLPTAMHEEGAVKSIDFDVRPAGDSAGDLADRLKAAVGIGSAGLLGVTAQSAAAQAAAPEPAAASAAPLVGAGTSAADMAEIVRTSCADRMAALQACDSDASCAVAHIALMTCIGQQVCPKEARDFEAMKGAVSSEAKESEAAKRFEAMQGCVERWGQQAQLTRE